MGRSVCFFVLAFIFLTPSLSAGKDLAKIAVWDLEAANIPAPYTKVLTSNIVSEISKLKKYEVYSQENVRTLAGWAAEKMKLGCTDTQCLTALGQMDIGKLISGNVGKVGKIYSVSLNLFDTQNARAENAVSEDCQSEDDLIPLIRQAVRKLLGEPVDRVISEKPGLEKEQQIKEKALLEERQKLEAERRAQEERQRAGYLPQPPIPREPIYPAGFIPKLNAQISTIKFFEGDIKNAPPSEKRVYSRIFPKTQSRAIYAELNLTHPAPGYRIDFLLETVYYSPNGNVLGQNRYNSYVMAEWSNSSHWAGWGWPSAGPNTWLAGQYRVDFYVDGIKIAEDSFTIY
jgi:hypothetical protein